MSCLFNSLFPFIPSTHRKDITSVHSLRLYLCEYLSTDPELLPGLPFHTIVAQVPEYLSRMKQSSTWGGAIEILAFANCFASAIVVYSTRAGLRTQLFVPATRVVHQEACITYNGGHYEPVKVNV